MALLKYVGISKYGVSVTLSNLRTRVRVTPNHPVEVQVNTDSDRRYYKSLRVADVELVEDELVEESKEEVVEVTEVDEVVEDTKEIEVEDTITKESVHEKLVQLEDAKFQEIVSNLDHKTRKKNKDAVAWELVEKFELTDILNLI